MPIKSVASSTLRKHVTWWPRLTTWLISARVDIACIAVADFAHFHFDLDFGAPDDRRQGVEMQIDMQRHTLHSDIRRS